LPGSGCPEAGSVFGGIVVLGGRHAHVLRAPGPAPAIVLLGGCGVPSHRWDAVAARLGERLVVRLDRPGLEGTPWPGRLPTLRDEVDILADLLAGLDGPAVLVAHSMAGLHAEALARTRPELVSALVLVEGSVELRPRPPRRGRLWLRAGRAAWRLGDVPAVRAWCAWAEWVITAMQSTRLQILRPSRGGMRPAAVSGDAIASVIAEFAAYHNQVWDLALLRGQRTFPAIPVRVLSVAGGRRLLGAQSALAGMLGGEHQVIAGSGHLMMIDRPDAVAAAVLALLGA
jgi:pimeloyl-ACP methyl ester carboxylesterase